MKISVCFVALAAVLGLSISAQSQILVGSTGTPTITFDSSPTLPATEWATSGGIAGNGDAFMDGASLDTGVQALDQSSIATALPRITADGQNANSRHNTTAGYVTTQPTGIAALLLKATLRNNSGSALSHLTLREDFGSTGGGASETAPGHEVLFSTNGLPNSWVKIPEFSGVGTTTAGLTATIFVGTWAPNSDLYIIWADDNAQVNPEGTNNIDNFAVSSVVVTNVALPLSVVLTAPTDGSLILGPADVTLSANTSGSVPATSVGFFTNGVLAGTDTGAPFSVVVSSLPAGTYTAYARAVNATETVFSSTNTFTVRNDAVPYTGGLLTETFDSMGPTGTNSPVGWYVGAGLPATSFTVTVGDGSVAAATAVLGWNYGTASDSDRALGTAPTGNDRNIVVHIKNNTAANITSFDIHYDGEVWRTYTNAADGYLTNFVSFDLGTNWIATGFDFGQAMPRPETPGALNGNDPANRVANIGGTVIPPTAIPPGGVIYIRWFDFNGTGITDGGLAVDNFQFSVGNVQSVTVTTPTNGATFAQGVPITVAASALMANTVTNVAFFRDSILIGNDTNSPFSVIYSNASLSTHTLTATATDSTGATLSSANLVQISVVANNLPSISITNPAPGSTYLVGTMVTNVSASASDVEGVSRVEFFLDGVLWTTDTTSAYGFDLGDITAGPHTIAAVVVDTSSARVTNSISISATNPPGITVIITNGSSWKYLDDGTDQGTAWRSLAFIDTGWSNGVAELGYGDAPGRPERTTVGFGPNTNAKFPTTYFRKTFTVGSLAAFTGLSLNVLADDHFIVYINGNEVFRDMTNATVTFATFESPAAPHDGTVYTNATLPTTALNVGANVIAVEIHQDTAGSSDISFDAMLWGVVAAGPRLTVTRISATQADISWPTSADISSLYFKTDLNSGTWNLEPALDVPSGGFHHVTVSTATGNKFWTLRKP